MCYSSLIGFKRVLFRNMFQKALRVILVKTLKYQDRFLSLALLLAGSSPDLSRASTSAASIRHLLTFSTANEGR